MNCTDKEQETCQVEKMGCEGCYYNKDEIVEGEYVKTNDGHIGKLMRIERDDIDTSLKWYVLDDGKNERYINKPYIVKHSKKLIDLIENDDIVLIKTRGTKFINLGIVRKREDSRSGKLDILVNGQSIDEIEILEILTHEQFEQNCYEVEDK